MDLILDKNPYPFPLKKIVCVGRNYAEHAKELNNPIPGKPILFMKPATSAVPMQDAIVLSSEANEVHHELEIALLMGEPLKQATPDEAGCAVAGVGLALDLTLREAQAELKQKGHPWEIAKGFDGACPLSHFVSIKHPMEWSKLQITFNKNGQLQQHGSAAQMLFAIPALMSFMSQHFTLEPGDIILTGTPAGVSALRHGDILEAWLYVGEEELIRVRTSVQ